MVQIISFKNAQIPQFEVKILQEIEMLTEKDFTKVDKIKWDTQMGFLVENQRVIGIGLYDCGLLTLRWKLCGKCIYSNPYVIEYLVIDGGYSGSCILIEYSEVYFIIENCWEENEL